MAISKLDQVLERVDDAFNDQERLNWTSSCQEIADYIHPDRRGFIGTAQPGMRTGDRIVDDTAPIARDRLASRIHGSLISRLYKWFLLTYHDQFFNKNRSSSLWLQDCADRSMSWIDQSAFYTATAQCLQDYVAFGMCDLYSEERASGLEFEGMIWRDLPPADVAIDVDADGNIDCHYRRFQMTLRAAVGKWGRDWMGQNARQLAADGKWSHVLDIEHSVYPRSEDQVATGAYITGKTMPWASCWVEKGDNVFIDEGGYQDFPFMIARWRVAGTEKYGRGPGWWVLSTVKQLNAYSENGAYFDAKVVDPALNVNRNRVESSISTDPGHINWVTADGAVAPTIATGVATEAINARMKRIEDLVQKVKEGFYINLLEIPQVTNTTAFEFARRIEFVNQTIGPAALANIESGLLTPAIHRQFAAAMRKTDGFPGFPTGGPTAFQKLPDILRRYRADIAVEYQGPLAKNQRITEAEGIEYLGNAVIQLQPVVPGITDNVNWDEAIRLQGDIRGVPASIFTDKQEMAQTRADRQAEIQRQQEIVTAQEGLKAMGAGAPVMKAMQEMDNAA